MATTIGRGIDVPYGHRDQFFIGGQWVDPSSSDRFDLVSPISEEYYASVAEARESDMNRAVAAARDAFDRGPWPRLGHAERATFLNAIGRAVSERSGDIARIWPNETGVLQSVAALAGNAVGDTFHYYAGLAETFPFEEQHKPLAGGHTGLLTREPVGVVAAIIPWNHPLALIANKIAPALLAGCTVVIKASPEAPGMAYLMAEIAEAVSLPAGVLNIITADRDVSEALVRHPGIDKIAFTGSTAAGRRIAALCGDRITRYTLELGGKSAAVILDDYDVEAAAQAIAQPACFLSGQVCSSLTRIIVPRQKHDRLVEALGASFGAMRVGDPFETSSDLGPVAMRRQRDRIEQLIAQGKEEGAVLAAGGGRPTHLNRGFFIEPTVFGNVRNDFAIAREEIFGPVLSVIPVDSEAEAIETANDTIYGLNNSVFTNDPDRAYRVARRLLSGTVGHNVWRTDFSIAFGGFKQSGVGREGGTEGLLPYLETKTIVLEGRPSHIAG
ncbi:MULTISPECIES: aldehyde dehydrogenase [unclassified Sphingomonas]|uniref:aldehyde dehydrogenase n=1 Tax=unclassified Sphingomonas TaxID=196159 RepID=UPI0006FFEE37|nr:MULTISPECIES: aldehyde dehydrogenase [unclassified Sphingomonas]KQX25651.1 aldehyde dehydrogenase [Sphingomonas sp. Root1294]KQY66642.1 aldehyde dehydrogenase [Sphingomonas sp. Root50]KRB90034.1 aldehyde dehydrogenase [Sphingomonas sp. Root720]